MRFNLPESLEAPDCTVKVGNVYKPRGGRAIRDNWLHVIMSITTETSMTGPRVVVGSIDVHGELVSATIYGAHVFQDRVPIGYVKGLEELDFEMEIFE